MLCLYYQFPMQSRDAVFVIYALFVFIPVSHAEQRLRFCSTPQDRPQNEDNVPGLQGSRASQRTM